MNLEKVADAVWKIVLLATAVAVCSSSYLLFCPISESFGIACATIIALVIIYDRYCQRAPL
jgi:hypothetical protein